MTQIPLRLTVISTVGQPTIGKPLIGQARGQLRLTWRSYVGPPQSGEISFHDSYKLHCVIAVGDFGAQSLIRTKGIIIHNHIQHRSK